ncbi:hypothetical protein RBSH_01410 [Rhodopirellula baltica SH28]|uniref:Uncharacterized protein n=3 Tax=Rhodopirellula baltica TaxID=265606 RepID=F2AP25_RHOBT|nr:hypothetical protein RBWH47_03045 [Rhodopirellula baltica WH47]EKK03261.1 hypothetical protein RBSH_01410 [Rhodopirellula baltica SH28]ELP32661.1 hypothetical protein RBSWK_03416 [Rhodopirellula baltica SWK14]
MLRWPSHFLWVIGVGLVGPKNPIRYLNQSFPKFFHTAHPETPC